MSTTGTTHAQHLDERLAQPDHQPTAGSTLVHRPDLGAMFLSSTRQHIAQRYRQLVESSTDFAIFTMNVNGRVTSWNSGAENVFGWSADSIIGQDASVLFTPEDRAKGAPQAEMKTALATGRTEDERWHVRNDGTRFYASGVMTSLGHGKKGLVKICRDATEKVHAADLNLEKQTLRRLIAAQEFDRGRIARDIHDHFGQQVTALRLILEDVKKLEIDPKINERDL